MPHEIVERHNYESYRIMERPDVRLRFARDAIGFKSMTSDELTKLLATEIARWAWWCAIPPSNAAKFAPHAGSRDRRRQQHQALQQRDPMVDGVTVGIHQRRCKSARRPNFQLRGRVS